MKFKTLILTVLLFATAGLSAQHPTGKLTKFLSLPTKQAQSYLNQFSSQELLDVHEAWKLKQSISDQRKMWLIEECYKRQGQLKANNQVKFLSIALVLLFSLVIGGIFYIISRQKKMALEIKSLK